MSLVVVGSVAYDGVETPHGKVDRMLGGACTYISLAASFFTPVKLVGVVGDDFAQADVDLLAGHRIDLEGLERVPGKTFFWSGVYSDDMNDRTTTATDLNVFADFDPKLPSYRSQRYLLLGNIQPALQRSVRAQMNGVRFVGGDTMNYWIQDFRDELLATIREWDFLLINDSEARMLAGCHNLRRAAEKILDMGPHAGDQARRVRRDPVPPGRPLHRARISAARSVRSHRRGRLFRRRIHGISGGARHRPLSRVGRSSRAAPRRDLRLGDGQLLLRNVRRGPFSHSHARGDRCPLPGIPGLH